MAIANKWLEDDPFIEKRYTRTEAHREAVNEAELVRIMTLDLSDFPSWNG